MRRTQEEDVAWQLLRADTAPLIASILGRHLGGEARRLPTEDLVELVDIDLDELRSRREEQCATGRARVAEWRASGYLVARPVEESRGETMELSAGALSAIRTLESLVRPRQSVTESRLSTVAAQLARLVVDSDPDTTRRLQRLHAEREQLDREIQRVRSGDHRILSGSAATERMQDIAALAAEIPSDFGKVRARFEQLNVTLRERILDADDSQGHVLDEIFRGVDLIQDSEEGRSFQQFLALLLDVEAGAAFDHDVDQVLARPFASGVPAEMRRFLRRFRTALKAEGLDIQRVVAGFARGLRSYVQSQEYQRDRALRQVLRAALAEGLRAAPFIKPFHETGIEFELSSLRLSSVGALNLHDPAEMDASEPLVEAETDVVDFEALRAITRETEIDFDELRQAVAATLDELTSASVADVLGRHPATQGVASVVGLVSLALAPENAGAGDSVPEAAPPGSVETVAWADLAGEEREATIRRLFFRREEGGDVGHRDEKPDTDPSASAPTISHRKGSE